MAARKNRSPFSRNSRSGDSNQSNLNESHSPLGGDPFEVPPKVNIVAEDSTFEGVFNTTSSVRVSGSVIGSVIVSDRVVVSETGRIEGTLHAKSASVSGSISGDIVIEDTLTLSETAHVEASITTDRLIVKDGAKFTGTISMVSALTTPEKSLENSVISAETEDSMETEEEE